MQQVFETAKRKHDMPSLLPGTDQDVIAIMLGVHDRRTLPTDAADALGSGARVAISELQGQAPGALQVSASSSNWEAMQRLSKAYFDMFNFLYPIMDREAFNADILQAVVNEGFDEGTASTLAFLVFALGEVAIAGTQGHPIADNKGRPSGFRGGSLERPPGLAFFNEARKRMAFSLTECSLENVQMFALAGYVGILNHPPWECEG